MAWSHALVGLSLASGFTLGVACINPGAVTTADGGSESEGVCPIGSVGCPCTGGKSCDPGLVCASDRCVDPDQGTTTAVATTGMNTGTADPTTGDDTTAGSACRLGGAGEVDPACPPELQYCVAGSCVACDAIDCAAVAPSLPLCDPGTGQCVACLCDDTRPVCDPETNTCSKCEAHGDCPDSACDLPAGACLPAAATLWVGGGSCDDEGSGAKATPLCTLDEAFARVKDGAATSVALRVKAGSYSAAGSLHVPNARLVALVPALDTQGGFAIRIAAGGGPAIVVDPGARLLLHGVEVADTTGAGLDCAGSDMWLDRLLVRGAGTQGVAGEGCTVTLRGSVLVGNLSAGVQLVGGALRLENTFIARNGNFEDSGGGVYLGAGAKLEALYATFVDNLGPAGNPFSVACSDDPAKESVTIRNSVAINKGLTTFCDGASVTTSAWTSSNPQAGNVAVEFMKLNTVLEPDAVIDGVYRAIPGSAIDGLGRWKAGDPRVDFDGDARPSGRDAPDFVGADRPPQ